MTPNVKSMEKNNTLGFIKIIKLYFMKDTIKKMKNQATNLEKIFAKHILTKDLYMQYIRYSQKTLQ